jgi:hypothetical protein
VTTDVDYLYIKRIHLVCSSYIVIDDEKAELQNRTRHTTAKVLDPISFGHLSSCLLRTYMN